MPTCQVVRREALPNLPMNEDGPAARSPQSAELERGRYRHCGSRENRIRPAYRHFAIGCVRQSFATPRTRRNCKGADRRLRLVWSRGLMQGGAIVPDGYRDRASADRQLRSRSIVECSPSRDPPEHTGSYGRPEPKVTAKL